MWSNRIAPRRLSKRERVEWVVYEKWRFRAGDVGQTFSLVPRIEMVASEGSIWRFISKQDDNIPTIIAIVISPVVFIS